MSFDIKEFRKAGHWPSLLGAFLYFDFSFVVWVILGALGVFIAQDLGLSPGQKGLLVALPLLSGAGFRVILGYLVDQWGPKKSASLGLSLTLLPLLLGWLQSPSYGTLLLVGFLLGIAGASFAAALPMAGRWYPPKFQGLAQGIAGAGNSGTVLAAFFAPRLAQALGWQNVFGLLLLPWSLVLLAFLLMAKEPPKPAAAPAGSSFASLMAEPATWKFCGRYAVSFGGFVGLASFLPIFLHDQYGLEKLAAANLTAFCVLLGSFCRPIGGFLADRFGGEKVLVWVFSCVCLFALAASAGLPLSFGGGAFALLLASLGLGNGAIFQLVPGTFGAARLGRITGMMGAAGGIGGFCLPMLLGSLKQLTGSFSYGMLGWAALALALLILRRKGASLAGEVPELAEGA